MTQKFSEQSWHEGHCTRCDRSPVQVNERNVCKKCFLKK